MSEIKAVLFDKDGTLFNFAEVWGPIVHSYIKEGIYKTRTRRKEEAIATYSRVLGIDKYGNVYPKGVLFNHNRHVKAFISLLLPTFKYGVNPFKVALSLRNCTSKAPSNLKNVLRNVDFSGVHRVFDECLKRNYKVGIFTNDSYESTNVFIDHMQIRDKVSFVKSRNQGIKSKPNPEAIENLCRTLDIKSENICVVGDTKLDMRFAKRGNVGYKVSVLTGQKDRNILEKYSDAVYEELVDILSDKVLFP